MVRIGRVKITVPTGQMRGQPGLRRLFTSEREEDSGQVTEIILVGKYSFRTGYFTEWTIVTLSVSIFMCSSFPPDH